MPAAFVSTANAATYTYTGLNFSPSDIAVECTSPPCNTVAYTTSDSVTGYFTVPEPLSPSADYVPLVPTTYSFSDGIQTLTPSNSVISLFRIYTDASGGFENWVVIIVATPVIQWHRDIALSRLPKLWVMWQKHIYSLPMDPRTPTPHPQGAGAKHQKPSLYVMADTSVVWGNHPVWFAHIHPAPLAGKNIKPA